MFDLRTAHSTDFPMGTDQTAFHSTAVRPTPLRQAFLARMVPVLAALWLCSCAATNDMVRSDPFLQAPGGVEPVRVAEAHPQARSAAEPSASPAMVPRAGVARTGGHAASGTLGESAGGAVLPVAHHAAAASPDGAPAITFTPADPCVPLTFAGHPPLALVLPLSEAEWFVRQWPDEYLCDGGDRGLPVHYDGVHRLGLETEDTVVEYVDHRGKFHVKPTNRVCIYAPRFGAMRTVSMPQEGVAVDQFVTAQDRRRGVGLGSRTVAAWHVQRDQADGVRVRSRAGGVGADLALESVKQHTAPAAHLELVNTYQDLTFVRTGQFLTGESGRLAYGIQAAAVWTRDQSPFIAARLEGGQEVRTEFLPHELAGIEDRRVPGRLRIVKLADRDVASPGDVVTFTIRYDNAGDLELFHVRIVDNLTPRLEYIEDSATSDRDGQLVVEDNGEGSVVLRFELAEPLPGGHGGVVTFQTLVR